MAKGMACHTTQAKPGSSRSNREAEGMRGKKDPTQVFVCGRKLLGDGFPNGQEAEHRN